MGEAVRCGRLSHGTYGTHGTHGTYKSCLMSPVGRVTPIRSSAHGGLDVDGHLLPPGFWLLTP
jgi:hypothetical protein